MKVFAVELHHYREWTETLGYDREWKIQLAQSKLSFFVNKFSLRIDAFPLMTRMDKFLIIADGIRNSHFKNLFSKLKEYSPVELRGCMGYGRNFLEAEQVASKCLNELRPGELEVLDHPDSKVVAIHADVDSFTELTERSSIYSSFRRSMEVMVELQRIAEGHGSLVQYLGGDNFMIFSSLDEFRGILEAPLNEVKFGVGICENPRCAVSKATEALTRIRETRDSKWKVIENVRS
ncbi:GTP cyclohydrolase III [Sulfuracidifex tepidarius]|uniref:GTP cyclohydrolase III n=1 Tax=Sulfuracidifex tepidarius TaxID=1294262 RepID=A0A510DVH5_9CREN|nr:GTP cyclohydrolase IIa [Sulfuracidifex tepidarius]BBG24187.1 GTP cyclohydrolase III [Sulfuracidifex tepidarius]